MDDLLRLAHAACEVATKSGAQFCDVGLSRGKSVEVELEDNAIKSSDATQTSGASIRAYVEGGLGSASTAGLVEEDVLAAARNAAELAAQAHPDPDFRSLPSPAEYAEIEGLHDPRVAEMDVAQVVRYAVDCVEAALEVDSRIIVAGGAGCGSSENVLVNSLGVEFQSQGTSLSCFVMATVYDDDDAGCYVEQDQARVLDDFDHTPIGTRAAEKAVAFLGSRSVASGELPLVLGPVTSYGFLAGLCSQANAEDVQRKRSYLAGKKGERIASEHLTLVDDPLIARGISSSRADGEGFPRQKLTVVDRGVLTTYLHNSYTAGKSGEPNTGHSTRGGISPTNVVPALGQRTAAEMIADVGEGLYVDLAMVSPNGATGQISSLIDFGFKIENGELAYPIKNTMIGADMIELLHSLEGVSSDYREEPGMIMPTMLFGKVKVAGAR